VPEQSETLTYKLTGIPVWDQRGLARTARFLLQTLIPGKPDWSDIPDDLVIVSPDTHFIKAELIDTNTKKVLAEKEGFVAKLEATPVPAEIEPLAPFRSLFDIDLPEVVSGSNPSLILNYHVKNQPVKRKMRILVSVNPPPG
jgi:hypothetical protein